MRRTLPFLGLLALPACSNGTPPVSLDITAGQETTAFTEAPAVAKVEIDVSSPIDTSLKLSTSASPGGTFDFGNVPNTEQVTVKVTGKAVDGSSVMAGQSLTGVLLAAVASDMPVFIQRKGQWARPPSGLACAHVGGAATVKEDRAFVLTGGRPATKDTSCQAGGVDVYDMFALTGDVTGTPWSPVPSTMVSLLPSANSTDSLTLLVSATGGVFWDYAQGSSYTGCPPSSFASWADVAGGAAIAGTNGTDAGTWWVVGGTRPTGSPTNVILDVGPDCTLAGYTLNAARLGAGAAWINMLGLVVAGGSATAPGIEILSESQLSAGITTFTHQAVPDPVVGAAVMGTASSVVLLGGVNPSDMSPAPARVFDLANCTTDTCVPAMPTSDLPPLANASAFPLPTGTTLVIGTDVATGMIRTFLVDLSHAADAITSTEAPLREPRRGATPIVGPNNTVAILGGEHADGTPATSIELFTP